MKIIIKDSKKGYKVGEFSCYTVAERVMNAYLLEGTGLNLENSKIVRAPEVGGMSEYTLYKKGDSHKVYDLKSCQMSIIA